MEGGGEVGRLLWSALYAYGIWFSILIDAAGRAVPALRGHLAKTALHALLGFAFFVPMILCSEEGWISASWIVAGTVGAACAALFYAFSQGALRNRALRWGLGIGVPILLIAVNAALPDGVKRGWDERRTAASVEVRFDYWNGYYGIPVEAKRGQTVAFRVEWDVAEGGYGMSVRGPDSGPVGFIRNESEPEGGEATFLADRDGTYTVRLYGDRIRGGRVRVEWDVRP